jgi:glycosyltransferase involved in cell wall biosynthesis
VIYRGVDTDVFTSTAERVETVIFYFLGGLPGYSTFTHGRNTKGGMNLMKAWSKLDSEFKSGKIKLLFAGPDSDIPMVKDWQSALHEPGRVTLFGKIDPAGIPGFHKSGHVALVPSLEEGLPNVAMEAASTGNLVIANPVGGIPEIISNGINGITTESNDAEGLYAKMKWVIEHPDQITSIGKKAAENMQMNFSSKDFGKKYFEFYNEIVKR